MLLFPGNQPDHYCLLWELEAARVLIPQPPPPLSAHSRRLGDYQRASSPGQRDSLHLPVRTHVRLLGAPLLELVRRSQLALPKGSSGSSVK